MAILKWTHVAQTTSEHSCENSAAWIHTGQTDYHLLSTLVSSSVFLNCFKFTLARPFSACWAKTRQFLLRMHSFTSCLPPSLVGAEYQGQKLGVTAWIKVRLRHQERSLSWRVSQSGLWLKFLWTGDCRHIFRTGLCTPLRKQRGRCNIQQCGKSMHGIKTATHCWRTSIPPTIFSIWWQSDKNRTQEQKLV